MGNPGIRTKVLLALCVLVLLAAAVAAGTLARSRAADRKIVSDALSERNVAAVDKVIAMGERAIPLIFDELRRQPGHGYMITCILMGFTRMGKPLVDWNAPYIRKVLDDVREREDVRMVAADMLGWYYGSPLCRQAVVRHALCDPSIEVRKRSISAIVLQMEGEFGDSQRWNKVDQDRVRILARLLKDGDVRIREHTCAGISSVACSNLAVADVYVAWCWDLVRQCRGDSCHRVRKVAAEALRELSEYRTADSRSRSSGR